MVLSTSRRASSGHGKSIADIVRDTGVRPMSADRAHGVVGHWA
jgi:hypothetical protein